MSFQHSFAIAGREVPRLIDHAVDGLPLFDDADTVVQAIAVEMIGRELDRVMLACLAAHAIVEAAKARRDRPLTVASLADAARRLTDEDIDAIADEAAAKRRDDV